jgi:hypothetical protein
MNLRRRIGRIKSIFPASLITEACLMVAYDTGTEISFGLIYEVYPYITTLYTTSVTDGIGGNARSMFFLHIKRDWNLV